MNKILVIDDNKDYREDLMQILEFENYASLGAENGLIGLEMIHQHTPNIIVCDIDMPVMDGIKVLRAVKAHPIYGKIPFIVTTGNKDNKTIKTLCELGAETYMAKPINIEMFLITISNFCNNGFIQPPVHIANNQPILYED
ncbi:MAG: response regulator [bacterium]|nr:response regulator [bacterium]